MLLEAPTPSVTTAFTRATQDSYNPGALSLLAHGTSALYLVFVNDTSNANVRSCFLPMVTASVQAAYIVFGFLGGDPWANRPLHQQT